MRFFQPEIERTLKMLGVTTLVGLISITMAWGYEQRRQARTWQNVACVYRVKEVVRRAPMLSGLESAQDACSTLARLGLDVDRPR
jgi:hypothetical protein